MRKTKKFHRPFSVEEIAEVEAWKPYKRTCDDPHRNFAKIRTVKPRSTSPQ